MASLPDLLASLVQSAVRGASGGSRQCVAAATAAAIRVAAEVFLGIEAPSDTAVEAKERLGDIKAVILKRVEAGTEGARANITGALRKARNRAEHHSFGAGPGAWRQVLCDGQRGECAGKEVATPAAASPAELPVARHAQAETGNNYLLKHVDDEQHTEDKALDDVQDLNEACCGTGLMGAAPEHENSEMPDHSDLLALRSSACARNIGVQATPTKRASRATQTGPPQSGDFRGSDVAGATKHMLLEKSTNKATGLPDFAGSHNGQLLSAQADADNMEMARPAASADAATTASSPTAGPAAAGDGVRDIRGGTPRRGQSGEPPNLVEKLWVFYKRLNPDHLPFVVEHILSNGGDETGVNLMLRERYGQDLTCLTDLPEDVLNSDAVASEGVQHTAKHSSLQVTGDSERHSDAAKHLAYRANGHQQQRPKAATQRPEGANTLGWQARTCQPAVRQRQPLARRSLPRDDDAS